MWAFIFTQQERRSPTHGYEATRELPSERGVSAHELPDVTPVVPPEKPPQEQSKPHPQPTQAARKLQRQTVVSKQAARKLQRQTVVLPPKRPPIPDSSETERPEGTEGQSAPSQPTLRWLPSRFPQAPPPGHFSR
jgi:hypothetical protein